MRECATYHMCLDQVFAHLLPIGARKEALFEVEVGLGPLAHLVDGGGVRLGFEDLTCRVDEGGLEFGLVGRHGFLTDQWGGCMDNAPWID